MSSSESDFNLIPNPRNTLSHESAGLFAGFPALSAFNGEADPVHVSLSAGKGRRPLAKDDKDALCNAFPGISKAILITLVCSLLQYLVVKPHWGPVLSYSTVAVKAQ